jgi:dihydroorotate dehydrogenase
MQLRGIEFGPCWDAPGVRGWFGEGYWFHPFFEGFFRGFDFDGSTRVAKTTTMDPNAGNMPLWGPERDFMPRDRFPSCIWYSLRTGETANAVGLAGPGAQALLNAGLLTRSDKPFMISFMSTKSDVEARLEDFRRFIRFLEKAPSSAPYALQLNFSCPNTGLNPDHLLAEGTHMLTIGAKLGVPLIPKYNIFAPPEIVAATAEHPGCDAVCGTNAPPLDDMIEKNAKISKRFPRGSPLRQRNADFKGGGYSGRQLLFDVATWGRELKAAKLTKPLNLGGGIRKALDVEYLVRCGCLRRGLDSIFFASAAMVRPWEVQPIIRRAYELLDYD